MLYTRHHHVVRGIPQFYDISFFLYNKIVQLYMVDLELFH
jgi:hypothetical protein